LPLKPSHYLLSSIIEVNVRGSYQAGRMDLQGGQGDIQWVSITLDNWNNNKNRKERPVQLHQANSNILFGSVSTDEDKVGNPSLL